MTNFYHSLSALWPSAAPSQAGQYPFLKYGSHACTQYSKFGLTNDWYNLIIILLCLLTKCPIYHTQRSVCRVCCCNALLTWLYVCNALNWASIYRKYCQWTTVKKRVNSHVSCYTKKTRNSGRLNSLLSLGSYSSGQHRVVWHDVYSCARFDRPRWRITSISKHIRRPSLQML